MTKKPEDLRSARWFAPDNLRSMGHRSRAMQMGWTSEDWEGRPVIAVINTWSDLSPCHHHLRDRAEHVKKGVLMAGGTPVEMPVHSFSEQFLKPTSMLYRNMGAIEVEETLRSHPIDGAVLLGGCDKSTPALVMGAISTGLPFIYLPAGAMLRGNYAGEKLGSGTDVWKYWDERRAGTIGKEAWDGVQGGIARSYGTCMTMGTASTMMSIADGWGLTLTGASSIPAPDAGHKRMSSACGRRIVEMVWEDMTPDKIVTEASCRTPAATGRASAARAGCKAGPAARRPHRTRPTCRPEPRPRSDGSPAKGGPPGPGSQDRQTKRGCLNARPNRASHPSEGQEGESRQIPQCEDFFSGLFS